VAVPGLKIEQIRPELKRGLFVSFRGQLMRMREEVPGTLKISDLNLLKPESDEVSAAVESADKLKGLAKLCVLSACDEADVRGKAGDIMETSMSRSFLRPLRTTVGEDDAVFRVPHVWALYVKNDRIAHSKNERVFLWRPAMGNNGFLTAEEADPELDDTADDIDQMGIQYDNSGCALPFRKGISASGIFALFTSMPWRLWQISDREEEDYAHVLPYPERPGVPLLKAKRDHLRKWAWPPFLFDMVNLREPADALERAAPHAFDTRSLSGRIEAYYYRMLSQTIPEQMQFSCHAFPGRLHEGDPKTWFGDVYGTPTQ